MTRFPVLLLGISAIAALACGCQRKTESEAAPAPRAPAGPAQTSEELKTPIAKVDDVTITLGEFQDRINRQSPYVRQRYTSLEQKKEFLDSLIRFEVLAKEAERRGFDKDPEVIRTMKQVMIQKLMRDEFDAKVDPLRTFILPGGSPGAAMLHLCRTVCRRAERAVVSLAREEAVNPAVVTYLNRLSDLLFVLARYANKADGVEETPWRKD